MLAVAQRTSPVFCRGMTASDAPTPPPPTEQQLTGRAIRALRTLAGMTQAEAAEAYGCDLKSWYRYEKGERDLSFDQLRKAAEAVGGTRDELLDWRDRIAAGEAEPDAPRPQPYGVAEPARPFDATPRAGRRQTVINLDEGDAILSYPAGLSAASRAELSAHLSIILRKLGT